MTGAAPGAREARMAGDAVIVGGEEGGAGAGGGPARGRRASRSQPAVGAARVGSAGDRQGGGARGRLDDGEGGPAPRRGPTPGDPSRRQRPTEPGRAGGDRRQRVERWRASWPGPGRRARAGWRSASRRAGSGRASRPQAGSRQRRAARATPAGAAGRRCAGVAQGELFAAEEFAEEWRARERWSCWCGRPAR
jgi:hypothetical protein